MADDWEHLNAFYLGKSFEYISHWLYRNPSFVLLHQLFFPIYQQEFFFLANMIMWGSLFGAGHIILSIFKTSLSLTKFSPLSTLISEFIPNRRFLRLEKFTQELAEDLNELDEKIDTEFITTDEFAFIFEQCYKAASENYQKDKLDAFKSIILNSAINKC